MKLCDLNIKCELDLVSCQANEVIRLCQPHVNVQDIPNDVVLFAGVCASCPERARRKRQVLSCYKPGPMQ